MRKTFIITIGIILTSLAVISSHKVMLWLAASKRPQIMGRAYTRVVTERKIVALTFDDGPNPPCTDSILEVLKRQNVKATFFVVGKYVQEYPGIVKEIYSQGHQIGNHTWSHKDLIFRTPQFVRREIEKTDSIITSLGYSKEIFFRSPKGRKLLVLPYILSRMRKPNILFDVVAVDWERNSVDSMLKNVCNHVQPGSIILLHDGDGDLRGSDRSATVKLTQMVIDTLTKQDYKFVTVSELLQASSNR